MEKVNVIIELKATPQLEGMATTASAEFAPVSAVPDLGLGVAIDTSFPPCPVPETHLRPPAPAADVAAGAEAARTEMEIEVDAPSYIVRAELTEAMCKKVAERDDVVGVYADVKIETQLICPGSPPLGNHLDVERLVCRPRLRACGANGAGVLVAIVDTGVNMAYLASRGKTPAFDAARSWVPRPGLTPGSMPVGHGTMCAFDACIAAPNCTILDIALLASTASGGTVMDGLLSDAVRAYSHLMAVMAAPRRPGENRSLVVNNSWGMFHPSWDFPVGHPGNYSDNPNHPFNRIVGSLERLGADILFAAGNCGANCPDGRCQGVTRAIYGANSHPQVLSVAGVDTTRARVGYSTQGPGRLARNKPDLCGYTHFAGSGVYAADGGTSAATPVVAGVVAAYRSRRPFVPGNPSVSPAAVRNLFRSTATDLGSAGFDFDHGFGVVNGCAIARRLCFTVPINICRIIPRLCDRPIPLPIDICQRFPIICEGIPRRDIPIDIIRELERIGGGPPPIARDGGDGTVLVDLSAADEELFESMEPSELAEFFYYLGQYAGSGVSDKPKPAEQASGGGCGCEAKSSY